MPDGWDFSFDTLSKTAVLHWKPAGSPLIQVPLFFLYLEIESDQLILKIACPHRSLSQLFVACVSDWLL